MALKRSDLLIFNNVESTDVVMGALELPFNPNYAYIPGVTYSIKHESFVQAKEGKGSQVGIRKIGKQPAQLVKATASGGLRYNPRETADEVRFIPLDDVSKDSEEIFEPVDVARQSATGAAKADQVLANVLTGTQTYFTGYLENSVVVSTENATLTKDNIVDKILILLAQLDYAPDTLMVDNPTYSVLLQLVTSKDFIQNPRETAIRTGILGTILGLNVVRDYNLNADFVLYNKDHFPGFTLFFDFDIVKAEDFPGSKARAMVISGGGGEKYEIGDVGQAKGLWGIAYYGGIDVWTVEFEVNGGSVINNVKVADGEKLVAPTAPTKAGKTFDGWFTDVGLTQAYDFNTPVKSALTLYAKWVD